jgi:hypothetical protein
MLAQGAAKDGFAREVGGGGVVLGGAISSNLAKRSQGAWLGRPKSIRFENNKGCDPLVGRNLQVVVDWGEISIHGKSMS